MSDEPQPIVAETTVHRREEIPDATVREKLARHDEQLADHERVLRALEEHLATLVDRVRSFELKATVAVVILLAGSPQLSRILTILGVG